MLQSWLRTFLGLLVIVLSLYYCVFVLRQVEVINFIFHAPSFVLVCGLLFGISLMTVDFGDYLRFVKFIFTYSDTQDRKRLNNVEENAEKMLDIFNSEGVKGLRSFIQNSHLPRVWGIVLTKLEIKVPIQDIQQILEFRIRRATSKLDQDIATMRLLAATAPAVGMFGSVLGLIYLLADLKDFSSLGANMSLALLTTLYGIFVFVPIVRKLETRRYVAIKSHMNLSYWLEALEARKPSFYLKSDFSKIEENQ